VGRRTGDKLPWRPGVGNHRLDLVR